MAGVQYSMKQSRRITLLERVDALDARLKSLRQQQDRIKRQKKQIEVVPVFRTV